MNKTRILYSVIEILKLSIGKKKTGDSDHSVPLGKDGQKTHRQ